MKLEKPKCRCGQLQRLVGWRARALLGGVLLGDAVMCVIVSKDEEAARLLEKAETWLGVAVECAQRGESMGRMGIEVSAYHDLALCRWLSESPAGPPDLSRCRELLKGYVAGLPRAKFREEGGWGLPMLYNAGEAEFCVREFEKHSPRFSAATIRRSREGGMAYLLAKQQLEPVVSQAELAALADRFLAREIPELLGCGQYRRAALWVKLLASPQAGVGRKELLRRTVLKYV